MKECLVSYALGAVTMGADMISAVSDTTAFTPNRLIAALGTSRVMSARQTDRVAGEEQAGPNRTTPAEDVDGVRAIESGPVGKSELTEEEQTQIKELAKRDSEVRRHEQAHTAAAGQHAQGGPSFKYQVGPDGRSYAVGGEVKIDTSPVPNDPEATIQKMQQVRRAAMAPADPSAEDRQVAAQAAATAQQARAEMAKHRANPSDAQGSAGPSPAIRGQEEANGPLEMVRGNPRSPEANQRIGVFSQSAVLSSGRFIDVRV